MQYTHDIRLRSEEDGRHSTDSDYRPDTGDVLAATPLVMAIGVMCVGAGLTKPPAGSAVTTAVCCRPHTITIIITALNAQQPHYATTKYQHSLKH